MSEGPNFYSLNRSWTSCVSSEKTAKLVTHTKIVADLDVIFLWDMLFSHIAATVKKWRYSISYIPSLFCHSSKRVHVLRRRRSSLLTSILLLNKLHTSLFHLQVYLFRSLVMLWFVAD